MIDAMQSTGVMPFDAAASGATFIGSGRRKGLLSPQGLGILCCSKDLGDMHPVYLATASLADPPADLVARADAMMLKLGAGRFETGNFNMPDIPALGAALAPPQDWANHLASRQARVSPERGGVRVSFGLFNTFEDVDRLAQILAERGAPPANANAPA